jgi:hypothetical protein
VEECGLAAHFEGRDHTGTTPRRQTDLHEKGQVAGDEWSEELPEDPFEMHVPDFEGFNGPHADEIRAAITEYASGKPDYKALMLQESLHQLSKAVSALDEKQVRAALLCAIASSLRRTLGYEAFIRWVEKQ